MYYTPLHSVLFSSETAFKVFAWVKFKMRLEYSLHGRFTLLWNLRLTDTLSLSMSIRCLLYTSSKCLYNEEDSSIKTEIFNLAILVNDRIDYYGIWYRETEIISLRYLIK